MVTRRTFIKASAIGSAGLFIPSYYGEAAQKKPEFFGLHPFIENNPGAVFIMKTNVSDKKNVEAKLEAGLRFGWSVFVPRDKRGVPVNMSIPIKPNFKTAPRSRSNVSTIIDPYGSAVDTFFTEGVLEGIKELGVSGSQFHLREVNRPNTFASYGFVGMAGRVGADLRLDLAPAVGEGLKAGRDFNWTKVPDGIIFKEIPHLEPINTPNTWMLNIAKFKCHPLGMTLCCKNLQGSVAHNYQRFCNYSIYSDKHFHKNARKNVEANYKRHCKEAVIPRWDRPGNTGGKWLETWGTRTLDNVSATPCALHIIEGIFGRDGNAATGGPHPLDKEHNYNFLGGSRTGSAEDYMSNVIIFGRDIFRVDIIGHWLGGHEPGNFGLFHLALERGLSHALDPSKIPVYLWDNGSAVRLPLEKFERTSLLSMYLRKDYNGGKEPFYHQVDEPFDYNRVSGLDSPAEVEKPVVLVLYRNSLSPINPYISIEYRLPQKGNVRLEILDGDGHVAAVPAEGLFESGVHLAAWDTSGNKAGTYSYRLRYNDTEIKDNLILN